jgi:hypothetical protein
MNGGWALLGLIVGAVMTFAVQFCLELIRDARKAEQLSHAIAGEITALLGIVEARRYLDLIQGLRQLARQGNASFLQIHIEQTYFSVIEANLQNIGLLPVELPLLIPRFLTLSKSALEDISAVSQGRWSQMPPTELATMYDGLMQVMQAAMATGREIVTLVATIYGSPHGRYPIGLRIRMLFRRRIGGKHFPVVPGDDQP